MMKFVQDTRIIAFEKLHASNSLGPTAGELFK